MAKIIRCREVGVDCDFEARGATEKEVLDKCCGARSDCARHSGTYSRTPHVGAWRDP